ncbi:putative phospholipid hydroperoxide glutathione peroxidase 6 [Diplonema papillatum]|nr:putative phospholipid hydroperoxide glutathione peroxidase 6 [Diplonema papillatum]
MAGSTKPVQVLLATAVCSLVAFFLVFSPGSIAPLEQAVASEAPLPRAHAKIDPDSVFGLTATDIQGARVDLRRDYKELVYLHEKYQAAGFVVLAFPSNQFGKQEPGTESEIAEFVKAYSVRFPMFAKIDVKGAGLHPLYRRLKKAAGDVEISWNFAKFLVSRTGKVTFFEPAASPRSMEAGIQKLLAETA